MNDDHENRETAPQAGPTPCARPDRRAALGKLAYTTPALITLLTLREGHAAIGSPPLPPGPSRAVRR